LTQIKADRSLHLQKTIGQIRLKPEEESGRARRRDAKW
jgi:hypothetical protein